MPSSIQNLLDDMCFVLLHLPLRRRLCLQVTGKMNFIYGNDILIYITCHSERSEESREHKEVNVHEILPPFGRLNDNYVLTDILFPFFSMKSVTSFIKLRLMGTKEQK